MMGVEKKMLVGIISIFIIKTITLKKKEKEKKGNSIRHPPPPPKQQKSAINYPMSTIIIEIFTTR